MSMFFNKAFLKDGEVTHLRTKKRETYSQKINSYERQKG